MEKANKQQYSILVILANTMLAQSGEEFMRMEPISDTEFYSGLSLVGGVVLIVWLLVHVLAG